MKSSFLFIALSMCSFANTDLVIREGNFRTTYDHLILPQNEGMGLIGTNYLLDFDGSYFGLGIYGAVDGQRGGFFTGGFELGYKYKFLDMLSLDIGTFVGGGGGGSAPQGGGLMLRPHIATIYDMDKYSLSVGLSKVKFPNGEIDSTQAFVALEVPFKNLYKLNTNISTSFEDIEKFFQNNHSMNIGWSDHYLSFTSQRYFIPSGVYNTENVAMNQDMTLIGFEYGNRINKNTFAYFETSGALGGGTDGYAEVLAGIGYRVPLGTSIGLTSKVALGASGGGRVETGGGAIHKESIGGYLKLSNNVSLATDIGYIGAFSGNFHAYTSKLSINYATRVLSIGNDLKSAYGHSSFESKKWNIRLSNQRYLSSLTLRKGGLDSTPIDLVGFKIDRYINTSWYVTGQALGAYKGKSGGYASGLIGLGYRTMAIGGFNLFTEALIGAGGGGSVASGNGAIMQPTIGLEYALSNSLGIQVSTAKIQARGGSLDANVIDFGLNYKFRTIE